MKITDLNKNYDKIAPIFAKTRMHLHWPELDYFYQKIMNGQKAPGEFKLLDIGCGSGRFYDYLQNNNFKGKYIGIDQSEKLIKEAQQAHPAADFRVLDAVDIGSGSKTGMTKLPENNFDAVLSLAMWHHLEKADHLKTLKELAKKMAPDSYFYLTVWNMWNYRRKKNWWNFAADRLFLSKEKFYNKYKMAKADLGSWKNTITLWQKENQSTLFYYAFTKRELRQLFEKAGFTVEKLEYSGGNCFKAQNIVLIAKKNN